MHGELVDKGIRGLLIREVSGVDGGHEVAPVLVAVEEIVFEFYAPVGDGDAADLELCEAIRDGLWLPAAVDGELSFECNVDG